MSNSAQWRKFQDSVYLWNWHWCHRLHCEDPALHILLPAGETKKNTSWLMKKRQTCHQIPTMLLLHTSTVSESELYKSVCIFANVGCIFHSLRHVVGVYGLYLSLSLQSKCAKFAMYCTGLPGVGSHHKQLLPQSWYIPILPWQDGHNSPPFTRISQPSRHSGFLP